MGRRIANRIINYLSYDTIHYVCLGLTADLSRLYSMSVIGTQRTSHGLMLMSVVGGIAEVGVHNDQVRF